MSVDKTSLADRMKYYENMSNKSELMKLMPVLVRLDGRSFHSFTRGLIKPFDERLTDLMIDCTKYIAGKLNAEIAYTQSDEISLLLYTKTFTSEIFFCGKISKINSIAASMLSVYFNDKLGNYLPMKQQEMNVDRSDYPVFDCRCWTVPNKTEAVNYFIWREQDAVRNSIQCAGQAQFSHKALNGVSCDEIQEMLFKEKGINWNDYPAKFKRGTYIKRVREERTLTKTEWETLPPEVLFKFMPSFKVVRNPYKEVEIPILSTLEDREGFIFSRDDV